MKVKIKKLHPDAVIPKYAKPGDSGFDFVALEDVILYDGETKLIRTGIAVEIPEGFELQVRPRSGTSLKTPLRVANAPGTIDSSFRGECCIIMTNTTPRIPGYETAMDYIHLEKGDRIAQGVICPVIRAEFEEVEELSDTERGSGGFGSTGK